MVGRIVRITRASLMMKAKANAVQATIQSDEDAKKTTVQAVRRGKGTSSAATVAADDEKKENCNTANAANATIPPSVSIAQHFKKRAIRVTEQSESENQSQQQQQVRKSPRVSKVNQSQPNEAKAKPLTRRQLQQTNNSHTKENVELPSNETEAPKRRGRARTTKSPAAMMEPEPEEEQVDAPSAPVQNFNAFAIAKRVFHRSGSFRIVGRVEEKAEFSNFWYNSVAARKGASIYISGNPGTGKTALVDAMLNELTQDDQSIRIIKLNCMMLKDPLKAFNEIAGKLDIPSEANPFLAITALEQRLCNAEGGEFYVVIVVDEVDQIGAKDPELLCKLLAIPFLPNACVSVIGIANSMDLTERFLPRLKVLNCDPQVLHFSQYSIPDISAILTDRLEQINDLQEFKTRPFIDRAAIEFTARKVASTGDLRRALDMIRQAIDLAEEEEAAAATGSNTDNNNNNNNKPPEATTTTPPTSSNPGAYVKVKHVAKIVEKFGSAQSGPLLVLKALNLHQKVILAAFLSLKQEVNNRHQINNNNNRIAPVEQPVNSTPSKKHSSVIITPQKLFDAYCSASLRPPRLYEPVTRSEFVDLLSNLESMSVIGRSGQDVWGCKVYLIVPGELVLQMLEELGTIKVLFGL